MSATVIVCCLLLGALLPLLVVPRLFVWILSVMVVVPTVMAFSSETVLALLSLVTK